MNMSLWRKIFRFHMHRWQTLDINSIYFYFLGIFSNILKYLGIYFQEF
jgi:hypothetical protein